MKMFLFGLFLIPALCFAQKKKDSKIIIHADTSGMLSRLAMIFYEKGFTIAQRDNEAKFIATSEKGIKSYFPVDVKIMALVKDSVVIITGNFRVNAAIGGYVKQQLGFESLYYGGMKGSAIRDAWNEMDTVAKSIGGTITYSR